MAEQPLERLRIGYALAPKKQQTLITPSLLSHAHHRGLDLVPLDPSAPLASQGPLHAVLHKLSTPEWASRLQDFASQNPGTPVVDPPHRIQPLRRRSTMLDSVSQLSLPRGSPTLGVPNQLVIRDPVALSDDGVLGSLAFPVIAKPVEAEGSAGGHAMAVVLRREGLCRLDPPVVLQEFVNHGGVVFKGYVVGDYVQCVKRKSLPDVSDEMLERAEGLLPFSQVSNAPVADGTDESERLEKAEMPPEGFIEGIARGLRRVMGLNLFNFDVIRDSRMEDRYLVIDINYFPGYAKMPGYERVLTDFLLDIVQKNRREDRTDLLEGNSDDK